jgi:sugar/nucleoside kinase (ribokinase family)
MKIDGVNFAETRESLIKKLGHLEVNVDLAVMPDFFLDHSLAYSRSADSLAKRIISVATKGGGEIPDTLQRLDVGGNAAICALALSRLGAKVHPIMKTNSLGLSLLEYFCRDFNVDLSHVKTSGNLSPTVILELGHGKKVANVMVGDWSGVSALGFDDFQPEDMNLLSRVNFACVFNWLYNRKGTELAESVFRYCKQNSKAQTFFDPADPWPRRDELSDLVRRILRNDLVDFLAVNDNEAVLFATALGRRRKMRAGKLAAGLQAGEIIGASTNTKTYVHSANYSASTHHDHTSIAPTFELAVRRGTGAGDSWNAGILIAESLGLHEEEKLLFANAVAARYISQPERTFATMDDMAKFLRDPSHRLKNLRRVVKS